MLKLVEEITYDQESITKTNLQSSHFLECHFKNIDFSFKDIKHSTFQECTFTNCNLSGSILAGSSFITIKFYECKISGTNFSACQQLFELDFNNSIVRSSTFQDLKSAIYFSESDLTNSDFSNSKLTGSSFKKCNLGNVIFNECDLSKCDFREATNYYIDLKFVKVSKSKFSSPEVLGLLNSFDIIID